MKTITEEWIADSGRKVITTWHPTQEQPKFKDLSSLHAHVIAFTKEGKVIVIRDPGAASWNLPGGTVEKNETPEQALVREVDEEIDTDLEEFAIIGYNAHIFPEHEHIKTKYNITYAGIIRKIRDQTIDPAMGAFMDMKLIEPSEFNTHIVWGEIGKDMFKKAKEYFLRWKETNSLTKNP
jgi:hypothetical protein